MAASPTAAEFKALFPQFAAKADDDVERWLAQAPLRFMPRKFGTQWSMAAYLYAAHQLVLFDPDSADASGQHVQRGAVTSEKVGDLQRNYASPVDLARVPPSLLWLTTTVYGLQLIGVILSRSAAQGRVVRTGSSYAGIDTTTTT
jgi:hypothetical protein